MRVFVVYRVLIYLCPIFGYLVIIILDTKKYIYIKIVIEKNVIWNLFIELYVIKILNEEIEWNDSLEF